MRCRRLVVFLAFSALMSSVVSARPALRDGDRRAGRTAARVTPAAPTLQVPVTLPSVEARQLAELTTQFREGTTRERQAATHRLTKLGLVGLERAAELVATVEDAKARKSLEGRVRRESRKQVAELLAADATDAFVQAQSWLEAAAPAGVESARDLAAFLQTSDRVRTWRAEGPAAAHVELWLARAAGDLEGALKVADEQGLSEIADALVVEMGEPLDLLDRFAGRDDVAALGLSLLAAQQLGDADAIARAETRLAVAEMKDEDRASVLLLAGRPLEALPFLRSADRHATAFRVLLAETGPATALDLVDRLDPDAPMGHLRMTAALQGDWLLRRLGKDQRADELLGGLFETLTSDEANFASRLAGRLGQLGRHDEARQLVLEALHVLSDRPSRMATSLVQVLHPEARHAAAGLWVLSRDDERTVSQRLDDIAEVLAGVDPKRLDALLAEARAEAVAPKVGLQDRALMLRGLAELAVLHGRDDVADSIFAAWSSSDSRPSPYTAQAELLESQGRHREAAVAWAMASQRRLDEPAWMIREAGALRSIADASADDLDRAEALDRRADLVALADDSRRFRMALAHDRLDEHDRAQAVRERALQLSDPSSWYHGALLRQLGRRSACSGVPAGSAYWQGRARLQALVAGRLTASVAELIARDHDRAVINEALTQKQPALALGVRTVGPWLDRVDAAADVVLAVGDDGKELQLRVTDALRRVVSEFPESARGQNQLAWYLVRLRVGLPEALAAAQRAVALEPTHDAYLDTLAEVHFQLGQDEQALAFIDKAIEANPDRDYLRRQRERFEQEDRESRPSVP
ncbi:MAG: hypothetical protein AAF533_10610 [Acidobacteriota bacterium]